MSDTIKCSWNGRGGPLEYGGRDWPREEIEAGIPIDVAVGLQSIRGPDFLIIWMPVESDVAAPEPPAKPKKPSKKGEE